MKNAHQHSFEPRPAMNKARKIEMRRAAFGTTLIALQWAYSKLLHETFESQWSSEVAANVRNLADAVVWKLTANLTFLDNRRSVALPQIAPAVYMMGVVSKAANYQRILLKNFMALTHSQKRLVSMITSPYEKEAWEGCEIMLRPYDIVSIGSGDSHPAGMTSFSIDLSSLQ